MSWGSMSPQSVLQPRWVGQKVTSRPTGAQKLVILRATLRVFPMLGQTCHIRCLTSEYPRTRCLTPVELKEQAEVRRRRWCRTPRRELGLAAAVAVTVVELGSKQVAAAAVLVRELER